MEIRQVAGLKNKLLGGEGFFNTLLTGPGKVWLQTMPISGRPPPPCAPFCPAATPDRPTDKEQTWTSTSYCHG